MATLQPVTTKSIGQASTAADGIAAEPSLHLRARIRAAEGIAHELAVVRGATIDSETQKYLDRALVLSHGADDETTQAKVGIELSRAIANELAATSTAIPTFDRWMPTLLLMGG